MERATRGKPGCILGSRECHWAKKDVAPIIEKQRKLSRICTWISNLKCKWPQGWPVTYLFLTTGQQQHQHFSARGIWATEKSGTVLWSFSSALATCPATCQDYSIRSLTPPAGPQSHCAQWPAAFRKGLRVLSEDSVTHHSDSLAMPLSLLRLYNHLDL